MESKNKNLNIVKKILEETIDDKEKLKLMNHYIEILHKHDGDEKFVHTIKGVIMELWKKDTSKVRDNFLHLYEQISSLTQKKENLN